jgi:hypothetical protein
MAKDTAKVEIPAELRPVVAAAAKNLATHLYGPEGPAWGTSFASIEELAVQLSRQLGAELIQQALQRQANQPAPAEPRSVQTTTGTAGWREPARYCPRCRRAFFPPEQGPGPRPD